MTIETKFNFGDRVWWISQHRADRIVHCETCKRLGTIEYAGESFTCPKCHGTSKHPQHAGYKWVVNKSLIIQNIRVDLKCDGRDDERRYMDTTCGSGTLYNEDQLFLSREEAEAECLKRNTGTDFEDER